MFHSTDEAQTPVPAMFATRGDTVYTPISGMLVSQKEIDDEAIAQGLLGKGYGILPVGNVVYAPANGRIDAVTVTNHAIGMLTEGGAQILVHIGLDTVDELESIDLVGSSNTLLGGRPLVKVGDALMLVK